MYCVNCGVKLADTEKTCPLCNTAVYHPVVKQADTRPLYPPNRMPNSITRSKALNGAVIILFMIPLAVCFFADLLLDSVMSWYGYVVGALAVAYVTAALPLWFRKPNPVIFVPCDFVAVGAYLLYIDLMTDGGWFLSFAFPVTGGLGLITCAVVTLMYYLRRGRLYILGGALTALGAFMLLIEFLLGITFGLPFVGWSIYPLAALVLLGGLLLYFAINQSARETMERKLFF